MSNSQKGKNIINTQRRKGLPEGGITLQSKDIVKEVSEDDLAFSPGESHLEKLDLEWIPAEFLSMIPLSNKAHQVTGNSNQVFLHKQLLPFKL